MLEFVENVQDCARSEEEGMSVVTFADILALIVFAIGMLGCMASFFSADSAVRVGLLLVSIVAIAIALMMMVTYAGLALRVLAGLISTSIFVCVIGYLGWTVSKNLASQARFHWMFVDLVTKQTKGWWAEMDQSQQVAARELFPINVKDSTDEQAEQFAAGMLKSTKLNASLYYEDQAWTHLTEPFLALRKPEVFAFLSQSRGERTRLIAAGRARKPKGVFKDALWLGMTELQEELKAAAVEKESLEEG